jgi:dTMP kinase
MAYLIAIEGIDGAGKGTQSRLLIEHLQKDGINSAVLTFPQYKQTRFGQQIGKFLDGQYGSLPEIHPLLFSLLFAGDRFESRNKIETLIAEHEVLIFDRYLASNQAHQGARLQGEQRSEFLNWIAEVEQEVFALPKVDLNILLDVPVAEAQNRIAQKATRDYTSQKADIQEANVSYLSQVRETYLELARNNSAWVTVNYGPSGTMLSPVEIHLHIYEEIKKRLGNKSI